jgi:hypothetical protein
MDDHSAFARRGAARLLIGCLAVLCVAVPVLAGPGERPEEKNEAAKVAKKVERALATAHQAEEEREALRHYREEVAEYADLHARQLAKLGARESVAAQKAPSRRHVGGARHGQAGRLTRPTAGSAGRRSRPA